VQLEGRARHAALKPGNLKPRLIAVGLKISKAETQLPLILILFFCSQFNKNYIRPQPSKLTLGLD
jgi:hypothetical protein